MGRLRLSDSKSADCVRLGISHRDAIVTVGIYGNGVPHRNSIIAMKWQHNNTSKSTEGSNLFLRGAHASETR